MYTRALPVLLAFSFVESFATILLERAVYFFLAGTLGFPWQANLAVAFVFGVLYAGAAMSSQAVAHRIGERTLLRLCLLLQIAANTIVALAPTAWTTVGAVWAIAVLNGLKWPVVESYMAAGRSPAAVSRTIGSFNMAWSLAVPLSLAAAGPMIASGPSVMFGVAAVLSLAALPLTAWIPARPDHSPAVGVGRGAPGRLEAANLLALVRAARRLLFASYTLLWVFAAIIPHVLAAAGLGVRLGAGLSGVLDLVRFLTFAVLQATVAWHGRRSLLLAAACLLPLGFALVLTASVPLLVLGEVLFGVSAGVVYAAALVYALVLRRGAVDAGGRHEAFIGLGFAAGPGVALLGARLLPGLPPSVGMAAGALALACVTGLAAVWPLVRGFTPLPPPPPD